MIKAVIFDVYGTLVKSKATDISREPKNRDAQIKALEELKQKYNLSISAEKILENLFDEIKKEHLQREKEGVTFPEIIIEDTWKKIFERLNLTENIDFKEFALEYHNLCCDCSIYPNTKKLLLLLKEQNVHLGIISNAQFYTGPELVRLLNIKETEEIFDKKLIFYSCKLGYSKPNQKIFDLLKKELFNLKIKPEETLFVGNDVYKDIDTARKVGFKTCLIENQETKYKEDMKIEEPDFKIKGLLEVKEII